MPAPHSRESPAEAAQIEDGLSKVNDLLGRIEYSVYESATVAPNVDSHVTASLSRATASQREVVGFMHRTQAGGPHLPF